MKGRNLFYITSKRNCLVVKGSLSQRAEKGRKEDLLEDKWKSRERREIQ